MPRPPSKSSRVTVYQLESPLDVTIALRNTYLRHPGFSTRAVVVAGRPGILTCGSITHERARWVGVVAAWLRDPEVVAGLGTTTTGCVLLLPTSDTAAGRVWALCFGMGFQMLEHGRVVAGLGRRLAVRCAAPDRLRSITRSRLDSRAFVARTSIPGGDGLRGFGAADLGELVSRIVAPAVLGDVLEAGRVGAAVELRAADPINLPLARDGARLVAELDTIERLLTQEPHPDLAAVEHLQALRPTDRRRLELEDRLDEALGGGDDTLLGLAWPTELADEAVPISRFEVSGLPRGFDRGSLPDQPSLDAILLPLTKTGSGERVVRLDRMRVRALSDDDEPTSGALPARRWLSFETTLHGRRFCLHDGRWYAIDEGLAERLAQRLADVFAVRPSAGPLPDWPANTDEAGYNRLLAGALDGVCLDRKLIVCETHPRPGFEAADVLDPRGVLLHVKAVDRSSPASHLFAQAGVSLQALLQDGTARIGLRRKVEQLGGDPVIVPDRPREIVLVMGNRRPLTPQSLPTFAGTRLVRLADECGAYGVRLSVISVLRQQP